MRFALAEMVRRTFPRKLMWRFFVEHVPLERASRTRVAFTRKKGIRMRLVFCSALSEPFPLKKIAASEKRFAALLRFLARACVLQ